MSRFDYNDPGTDPAYCDGLSATEPAQCSECGETILVDADAENPIVCDRCEPLKIARQVLKLSSVMKNPNPALVTLAQGLVDAKSEDPQDTFDLPDPGESVTLYVSDEQLAAVVAGRTVELIPALLGHQIVITDKTINSVTYHYEPVVDPAENAMHSLIDALTTLEQQIVLCGDKDLERANQLRQMARRHWQHATAVCDRAAAKCDEILERRR